MAYGELGPLSKLVEKYFPGYESDPFGIEQRKMEALIGRLEGDYERQQAAAYRTANEVSAYRNSGMPLTSQIAYHPDTIDPHPSILPSVTDIRGVNNKIDLRAARAREIFSPVDKVYMPGYPKMKYSDYYRPNERRPPPPSRVHMIKPACSTCTKSAYEDLLKGPGAKERALEPSRLSQMLSLGRQRDAAHRASLLAAARLQSRDLWDPKLNTSIRR